MGGGHCIDCTLLKSMANIVVAGSHLVIWSLLHDIENMICHTLYYNKFYCAWRQQYETCGSIDYRSLEHSNLKQ